jgi:hypothetical protein
MQALANGALVFAFALAALGCTQVPRESITLSETVGRDVAAIEASHRRFVDLVYEGYEKDVNAFVDDVYLPFYIQQSLQSGPGQKLLRALEEAARPGSTGEQRRDAYEMAEIWLKVAHQRVASMRVKLLAPLQAQRGQIRADLDSAYQRVHQANAAVTGYLASLARVTDLQNNLLSGLGVPKLSERVGEAALQVSSALDKEMPDAERRVARAEEIRSKLQEYLQRWRREAPIQ